MFKPSAAFYTIDHNILLETSVFRFGVGEIFEWFTSYLSQKTQQVQTKWTRWINQQVQTKGFYSDKKQLFTILQQISLIGSLQFTIYVADLFKITEKHFPEPPTPHTQPINGSPENVKKFQRVQKIAARLLFNLRKYDCITPALVPLHWLLMKYGMN